MRAPTTCWRSTIRCSAARRWRRSHPGGSRSAWRRGAWFPAAPRRRCPRKLKPMLAESGELPQSSPAWRYEPKLDGYRVIAFLERGTVRLQSRRGLELTRLFPEIVADLTQQPVGTMVLDGEIVALDADGQALLQRAAEPRATEERARNRRRPACRAGGAGVLRSAACGGHQSARADVRGPRRYLAQCLLPAQHLQLVHTSQDAAQLYGAALELGFEGIVAKRLEAPYQPGRRSPAWIKVKAGQSGEFVVGGYTRGKGARGRAWARCCSGIGRENACSTPGMSAPASTRSSLHRYSSAPPVLPRRAPRSPRRHHCTGRRPGSSPDWSQK